MQSKRNKLSDFSHPNDPSTIKVKGGETLVFDSGLVATLQEKSVSLLKYDGIAKNFKEYAKFSKTGVHSGNTKQGSWSREVYLTLRSLEALDDKTLLVMYEDDDTHHPYHLIKFYNMDQRAQSCENLRL